MGTYGPKRKEAHYGIGNRIHWGRGQGQNKNGKRQREREKNRNVRTMSAEIQLGVCTWCGVYGILCRAWVETLALGAGAVRSRWRSRFGRA